MTGVLLSTDLVMIGTCINRFNKRFVINRLDKHFVINRLDRRFVINALGKLFCDQKC